MKETTSGAQLCSVKLSLWSGPSSYDRAFEWADADFYTNSSKFLLAHRVCAEREMISFLLKPP